MAAASGRTIGEIQAEFEAVLARLSQVELPPSLEPLKAFTPPRGMSVRVSLRKADTHRQIRRTADASRWNPATCEVVISFGADASSEEAANHSTAPRTERETSGQMADLINALDRAERDPLYREFVGLKSFRDNYLASRGFSWAADPANRHRILVDAGKQGLVKIRKVPNPKHPAFPTSTISVNRAHPEVKRILAESASDRAVFRPIAIQGAPLSETIFSERR